MNRVAKVLITLIIAFPCVSNAFTPALSLSTTSTWFDFGLSPIPQEKEKCILTGLITFNSKKAHKLNSFILHWNGKPISSLEASLYVKKYNERLLTIKKYHICDGKWNTTKQEIIFNPNQKIVGKTTYYLVVTIPFNNEKNLKTGTFSPTSDLCALVLN